LNQGMTLHSWSQHTLDSADRDFTSSGHMKKHIK